MFKYAKRLQYPVNIKKKDIGMAKQLITQYGGPNGELAAALRYLNQRYTMPDQKGQALLTDIGTEELAHVEMLSTMVCISAFERCYCRRIKRSRTCFKLCRT